MLFKDKLDQIEARFEDLTRQMADPAVINEAEQYRKVTKAHSEISEVVNKYREWKKIASELGQARLVLEDHDPDLKAMAAEELVRLEPELAAAEQELKILLLPKDPNDEKNVVLEIRAGTGGDEATLFAAEIFRMYSRYAESQRWRIEVTSSSESAVGGLKEVIALVSGERVYSKLKYESGVHRVQRVPATEQQGRVHTSAVTVAVLPEADDVEIRIEPKDIRIDTFCSSGRAGNPSTPPIRRCASPTCPRGWWSPARTRNPRSRTVPRRSACCAPGCTNWNSKSSRSNWARSAAAWWAPATAARRSAPTTFRRTASPITASG